MSVASVLAHEYRVLISVEVSTRASGDLADKHKITLSASLVLVRLSANAIVVPMSTARRRPRRRFQS